MILDNGLNVASPSNDLMLVDSTGTPSTIYNGSLPPLIDAAPLIVIDAPALGSPEEEVMFIPGIFPCKAVLILPAELLLTSFPEKDVMAPEISRFI